MLGKQYHIGVREKGIQLMGRGGGLLTWDVIHEKSTVQRVHEVLQDAEGRCDYVKVTQVQSLQNPVKKGHRILKAPVKKGVLGI